MNTPKIIDVKVERSGEGKNELINVTPVWSGVDRSDTSGGWAFFVSDPKAEEFVPRLVKAIKLGRACDNPQIKTDTNGKTYVSFFWAWDRRMGNAGLKRLGV